MKKVIRIIVSTVFSFFALSFCSCITNVSSYYTQERELKSEIVNFNDYVKTNNSNHENENNSRTISADSNILSDYAFWLVYSKANEEHPERKLVKVSGTAGATVPLGTGKSDYQGTAITDGKFTIMMENASYNLTLYAVKYDGINYNIYSDKEAKLRDDAVLSASSFIDLRNDSGVAEFRLASNNLPGRSTLNFDLVLDKWNKVPGGSTKIELKDMLTNESAKDYFGKSTVVYVAPNSTRSDGWTPGNDGSHAYGNDSFFKNYNMVMKSGVYTLEVTYMASDNTTKLFIWSDIVIVMPNRDITSPVYIANSEPIKPAAPTGFMASFIEDSQNLNTDEYQVYFEWTDSDNYEEYFEMQLMDLTSHKDTDTTHLYAQTNYMGNLDDINWEKYKTAHSTETVELDFNPYERAIITDDLYLSGGLWANNNELTLKFAFEKRYLARIRAVNTAGVSEWTYVDLRGSSSPTKHPFDSDTINMYKVIYHLNGGRYSTANDITDPYTQAGKYTSNDFVMFGIQDRMTRNNESVTATGIPYWDGLHLWDSDGAGNMVSRKMAGTLTTDASASNASDNNGTGARDNALLGGLWSKYDTDGDCDYDYTKDTNFGFGSLQKVMDTDYHVAGQNDIVAFKYWVDDVSKDVSEADIKAATNKYNIAGKYKGIKNLELWAKYYPIKDPHDFSETTLPYNDPKSYDLRSEWIHLNQSAVSGTHGSFSLPSNTPSDPTVGFSKTAGNYVQWRINLPTVNYLNTNAYNQLNAGQKTVYHETEAYGLKSEASGIDNKLSWTDKNVISKTEYELLPTTLVSGDANDQQDYERINYISGLPKGVVFDSITGVAYKAGSYEAIWASTITNMTQGSNVDFPEEMDVSKFESDKWYTVVFTATYGRHSYQKSVKMIITD